jgi:hypothetical protein
VLEGLRGREKAKVNLMQEIVPIPGRAFTFHLSISYLKDFITSRYSLMSNPKLSNPKIEPALEERMQNAPDNKLFPVAIHYCGPGRGGVASIGDIIREGADYLKHRSGDLVNMGVTPKQLLGPFYTITADVTRDQVRQIATSREVQVVQYGGNLVPQ